MAKAKRISGARVKNDHTYTVEEAASVVGSSPQTIRKWVHRNGMPIVEGSLPWLIRGSDLKKMANGTRRPKMAKCEPDELTCMRCRAPRKPDGRPVDYIPLDVNTGRLVAICDKCGGWINRFTHKAKLPELRAYFENSERGEASD